MYKIFCLMCLLSAVSAQAQVTGSAELFPELAGIENSRAEAPKNQEQIDESSDEEVVQEEIASESDESIQNEDVSDNNQELFEEIPSENQGKMEDLSETPEEKEDESEGQQNIFVLIDDVESTLTPNKNGSFCSAAFVVVNRTKKKLDKISGTFTIGQMQKKFDFSSIAKGKAAGSKYMFIGTSCEQILNPPEYNIQKCQIEGWSEKKCKSKVKFVPLPNENI